MQRRDWKDVAELVGIAAIVASLIFVGLQMRQEQKIAQAQAWVDGAANYVDLSALIVAHQDIWMRGLYDEELSAIERAKFEQIARTWHTRLVSQLYVWNLVGSRGVEMSLDRTAYSIYVHPGLRRWFHSYVERDQLKELNGDAWSATITGKLEQLLAEMDRESVPMPSERSYLLGI